MTETFDTAKLGLLATAASASDRDLVAVLQQHGAEEGEILADYEQFAASAESDMARYLVHFIIEDERRHHRMLEEMANSVAWGGFEAREPISKLPGLDHDRSSGLREQTQRLLDFERQDAHALKTLRRKLKPHADSTIWRLLVDTMLLDTRKHELILEFILDHARQGGSRSADVVSPTPQRPSPR
jgi:hypothetical protein